MNAKDLFGSEYVSYSRLHSYEQCPRRFRLEYLEGLPCPSGRAAQLGSLVHGIIANYIREVQHAHTTIATDISTVSQRTEAVYRELKESGEITEAFAAYEVRPLLEGFCRMMPRIETDRILGVEKEKDFVLGDYRCKVIVDLLMRNEHGVTWLVDFKTGQARYISEFQLRFYALSCLAKNDATPIVASFALLRDTSFFHYNIDRKAALNTAHGVLDRVRRIEGDGIFAKNPSGLCRYCGVREYC